MKKKTKRITALVLALLLFFCSYGYHGDGAFYAAEESGVESLTDDSNDDVPIITPDVTPEGEPEPTPTSVPSPTPTDVPEPEQPVEEVEVYVSGIPLAEDPDSLPGFVSGVSLSGMKVKISVTKADGSVVEEKVNEIVSGGSYIHLVYGADYKYSYELIADNYNLLSAQNGTLNVTSDAEGNKVASISITGVTPKYEMTSISGNSTMEVGSNASFSVDISPAWEKTVVWSLTGSNGTDISSMAELIDVSGKSCEIRAKELSVDSLDVTLTAKGLNGDKVEKQVTINKIPVTLSFDRISGPWNQIEVVISTTPILKGVTINLKWDNGDEIAVTDENGQAEFIINGNKSQEYELNASYKGDSKHQSANQSKKYNPGAVAQTVVIEKNEVSITYGDENVVVASLSSTDGIPAENAIYTAVLEEEYQDFGTVKTQKEEDGTWAVLFTPSKSGENVKIKVTKAGDDDYKHAEDTFEISIDKKEVGIDPDTLIAGDTNGEKVYDGKEEGIEVKGRVNKADLVGNDEIFDVSSDNGVAESANVGMQIVEATLKIEDGTDASEKYYLANEGKVETSIHITPATLKIAVADAKVEYDEIAVDNLVFLVLDDTEVVTYEGFVEGEDERNLEGFEKPEIMIDTWDFNQSDISLDVPILDVLTVAKDSGNPTNNYIFDYVNVNRGSLTLLEENLSDTEKGEDAYIAVDNDSSRHVYQNEEKKRYFGDAIVIEDEVTSQNPVVKFAFSSSKYDEIYISDEEGNLKENITNNGFELDSDLEVISQYFVLKKSGGYGRTSPFQITFYRDKVNPESTVKIGDAEIPFIDFLETITFGVFSKDMLKVDIHVEDVGEEGYGASGIASWGYCIVNPTKDDVNMTEDTVNKYQFEEVKGADATISLGDAEEAQNYVIFVRMTDNVGNTIIKGTNGIIIENITLNEIIIDYKDNRKSDNVADYYQDDVTLDVTVSEDTNSIFSGVGRIDYTVTKDNSTSDRKNLFLREAPTEATLVDLYKAHSNVSKELTVEAEAGSKKVTVKISANDYAGNFSNPVYKEKSFVIDPVNPVIMQHQITDGTSKYQNGYYNTNVVVSTTIKERFINSNDIMYTIIKDGVSKEISAQDIQKEAEYSALGITDDGVRIAMSDEMSDESVSQMTLEFDEEGVYEVQVKAKDRSGREAASVESVTFTIDKTNPEADIIYHSYGSGEIFDPGTTNTEPKYLGENYKQFSAVLTVKEKNFSDGESVNGIYTVVAKNSANIDVNEVPVSEYKAMAEGFANWNKAGIGPDIYEYSLDFSVDANYSFAYSYEDLAGNPVKIDAEYVTLDKTKPKGTVIVNGLVNGDSQKSWVNYFLSGITFGVFGNTSASASLESSDETSGVKYTQYFVSEGYLTKTQLASVKWIDYASAIGLTANKNLIVYEKVVDRANNIEYYSSDSLIVDNIDPAPVVTITPSSPSWGKGVYSAGDNPGFDITVTDPDFKNVYSGLKEITYLIVNGTTGTTASGTLASIGREQHQQTWTGHVSINPSDFYSNDVRVTVTASDWSTNEAVSETATLKIDNEPPKVNFSFDKSDVQNGKYYKNNKTLTITVNERNFDQSYVPKVTSTAGGGYSFSGWSTSGEITTGTITFSGDSDYTVTFDCYDLAGNKSNTETLEEFTVDKTNPTISVSYDNDNVQNGSYYKASRTATITINEHNFRAGDVRVTTTASNGSAPNVSGWSSSGDRHTATVYFGSDADYTFDIEYTDLAGNSAADYDQDKFTVDLTKPVLEITGVANKSANKGTVAPVIRISDTNFIASGVTLTLKGANKGNVSTDGMVTKATANDGQTITFLNFGANMDDIYTLTAKSVDKAGNETTKSITFSVNRDGSAYTINDSTKELIEKGFTNNPQDIVITEINVDTLEFIDISISRDGKIEELKEGEHYTIKAEGGDGQWKKYTYTIFASCFEKEGEYSINISSTDRAENVSNNKAQSMNVDFVVDKTAPVMAISNLENRGRYKENSHEYTLNVKDNAMLVSVQIYLDGELYKTYELVNGKLVNVNDANDILEMDNGKVYLSVDSKNTYQTIKLVSTDAAGNVSESEEYNVLVTSSSWVQFYMNKPLFFGCIAAIVVVCGLIFFIIWKKKKEEEEKQTRARR